MENKGCWKCVEEMKGRTRTRGTEVRLEGQVKGHNTRQDGKPGDTSLGRSKRTMDKKVQSYCTTKGLQTCEEWSTGADAGTSESRSTEPWRPEDKRGSGRKVETGVWGQSGSWQVIGGKMLQWACARAGLLVQLKRAGKRAKTGSRPYFKIKQAMKRNRDHWNFGQVVEKKWRQKVDRHIVPNN